MVLSKEEKKLKRQEYNKKNHDKILEAQRKWVKNNWDKYQKANRDWYYSNHSKALKIAYDRNNNDRFGGNRDIVFARDSWICQDCGMSNEQHLLIFNLQLNIHHIDKNKLNNNLSNLKTLCVRCHAKIHNNERKLKKDGE